MSFVSLSHRPIRSVVSLAFAAALAGAGLVLNPLAAAAQPVAAAPAGGPNPHPEWSGVWRRSDSDRANFELPPPPGRNPLGAAGGKPGADGPMGPLPSPPPFVPKWQAKFDAMRARMMQSKKVWDPLRECYGSGMPRMMRMTYPMEIAMIPGKMFVMAELNNETRHIFINGRPHPAPDVLEPTMRGDSIGHWEGDTLVIDTIGLRYESVLGLGLIPHSDQLHIVEHVRAVSPNELEWEITLTDPVVFNKPWSIVNHYFRATDEIREYNCSENKTYDEYAVDPKDDPKLSLPDPELKTMP